MPTGTACTCVSVSQINRFEFFFLFVLGCNIIYMYKHESKENKHLTGLKNFKEKNIEQHKHECIQVK